MQMESFAIRWFQKRSDCRALFCFFLPVRQCHQVSMIECPAFCFIHPFLRHMGDQKIQHLLFLCVREAAILQTPFAVSGICLFVSGSSHDGWLQRHTAAFAEPDLRRPSSASTDTPNTPDKVTSMSGPGIVSSFSHLDTACLVTWTFSARVL